MLETSVILGRILLLQLLEANNSLVVLEPKLVAWKTENTQKPNGALRNQESTEGRESDERLNTSSRRSEKCS